MYYQVYIFLTGENFRLDEALMITESSAYNFTHLMLGGIFHRIASGSDQCKPCSLYSPHTSSVRCCRTHPYADMTSDPGPSSHNAW